MEGGRERGKTWREGVKEEGGSKGGGKGGKERKDLIVITDKEQ